MNGLNGDRRPIKKINLGYTMQCTAECLHCCTDSTPRTPAKMRLDEAVAYIEQIREAGYELVTLVGGEVMICFEELLQVMETGQALGLSFSMVTNGYWGRSPDEARRKLERLKESGLTSICTSWDLYHAPFIPLSAVQNILLAAAELEMPRALPWVERPGDGDAFWETVRSFRADKRYGDVLLAQDLAPAELQFLEVYFHNVADSFRSILYIKFAPLVVGGRVARACDADWRRRRPGDVYRGGCDQVLREAVVRWDGEVMFCCSPSAYGDADYSLGNLKREKFADILSRAETDPLPEMIRLLGPHRLYELFLEEGLEFPEDVSDMCHLCRTCIDVAGGQQRARQILVRREADMGFEKLIASQVAENVGHSLAQTAAALIQRQRAGQRVTWGRFAQGAAR